MGERLANDWGTAGDGYRTIGERLPDHRPRQWGKRAVRSDGLDGVCRAHRLSVRLWRARQESNLRMQV